MPENFIGCQAINNKISECRNWKGPSNKDTQSRRMKSVRKIVAFYERVDEGRCQRLTYDFGVVVRIMRTMPDLVFRFELFGIGFNGSGQMALLTRLLFSARPMNYPMVNNVCQSYFVCHSLASARWMAGMHKNRIAARLSVMRHDNLHFCRFFVVVFVFVWSPSPVDLMKDLKFASTETELWIPSGRTSGTNSTTGSMLHHIPSMATESSIIGPVVMTTIKLR